MLCSLRGLLEGNLDGQLLIHTQQQNSHALFNSSLFFRLEPLCISVFGREVAGGSEALPGSFSPSWVTASKLNQLILACKPGINRYEFSLTSFNTISRLTIILCEVSFLLFSCGLSAQLISFWNFFFLSLLLEAEPKIFLFQDLEKLN